jgi:hypothetical protein
MTSPTSMTSEATLRQELLTVEANESFTEAVMHFRDGSRLCFCHRVDERWAKAAISVARTRLPARRPDGELCSFALLEQRTRRSPFFETTSRRYERIWQRLKSTPTGFERIDRTGWHSNRLRKSTGST